MVRAWLRVGLLGLALSASSAGAVSISLVATPASVPSGNTVTLDIVASGFDSGAFASAYDLAIDFDPARLGYVGGSFAVGAALGSDLDIDFFDFTDSDSAAEGSLLPFVVSLLSDEALSALQPGPSVTLGSFQLLARRTSQALASTVGLTCNSVAGPFNGEGTAVLLPIDACAGVAIDIEPVSAPEPGTLALLGAGLLMLAGLRRRGVGDIPSARV